MDFWLVKLRKTWEKNKWKEKHLKNVIAHYNIHEHYVRIYKSALNYQVVETGILNCFSETLMEFRNNSRRIKVVSKMMLEMHPHISVYKELLKNNPPSVLLFEVEEREGSLAWTTTNWTCQQSFEGMAIKMSISATELPSKNCCYQLRKVWGMKKKTCPILRNFCLVVKGSVYLLITWNRCIRNNYALLLSGGVKLKVSNF